MGVFFFFQAEDGIRDHCVTGVQTCALPIFGSPSRTAARMRTSSTARPQILVGAARRISSPREIGVRPKPIAIESPSTQKASSPGLTTARASFSRLTDTGVEKYTSSPQRWAREANGALA